MKPELVSGNVIADCPECGVPTTFEYKSPGGSGEFGSVIVEKGPYLFGGKKFNRIIHKTLRCCVCSRPAVATVYCNNYAAAEAELGKFWPTAKPFTEPVPESTPEYIIKELREAESCIGAQAHRAAAAMLRSTAEKTLIANGYNERNLYQKIEAAGNDGVITSARRQRAQDLIRTLGNDVLHEEWREVEITEIESAHKYASRIIEDFYDDRETVVALLQQIGRLSTEN